MNRLRLPHVIIGVGAFVTMLGTPHLRFVWECNAAGGMCVHYTRCSYLGIAGFRQYIPKGTVQDDDCPVVKIFPLIYPGWANAS